MFWLKQRKIQFGSDLTKEKQECEIVRPHIQLQKNVIDYFPGQNGFEVLRLPSYHCQYRKGLGLLQT